jgi:hypothetical protein
MSVERGIRAGETIRLRARFRDDLGQNVQATSVGVNIYEPDVVEFDPSNALVVSGVPSYLGDGIFEFEYNVPSSGPDGIWYDQWLGDLTIQTVSGLFTFEVTTSGIVTELPSQLNLNNVVEVDLTSGIHATDGTSLSEPFEFSFMTSISPGHSSVRKVRLEVGAYIKNLFDDTIQTAILEARIEADLLTFRKKDINTPLYQHARREYVTCMASSMLLNNVASNMLRTKTLADLHVEYDSRGLENTLTDLRECIAKWEPQLMAGGLAKASAQPRGVVKGELDPDRVISSRMWESTSAGSITRRTPAANARERPIGSRRHLRTYKKKWW